MFCTDEYTPFHPLHTPLPEGGGREGGREGGKGGREKEGGRGEGGGRKGGRGEGEGRKGADSCNELGLDDSNHKSIKH